MQPTGGHSLSSPHRATIDERPTLSQSVNSRGTCFIYSSRKSALAGIRVWPVITVSCDFFAVDNCTVIILLIVLVSTLELVKCWLQLKVAMSN